MLRSQAREPVAVSAALLDRTVGAIYQRRALLKRDGDRLRRIRPKRPWTPHEYRFLVEHPELLAREVAAALDRTTASVYERRATLRRQGRG